jgi:hypothetical protein
MACATQTTLPAADSFYTADGDLLPHDSGFSDQNANVSFSAESAAGESACSSIDGGVPSDGSVPVLESVLHLSHTERLRIIQKVLDKFFNNEIKEAEAAIEPHVNECIHFSHTRAIFVSVSSFMTLDPVRCIFHSGTSCFIFNNRLWHTCRSA